MSGDLAAGVAARLLEAARDAFVQGFQVVASVSAVIAMLAAAGVVAFLTNLRPSESEPSSAAAVPESR